MDTLFKADIFFFITSIAVVLITLFLLVVLFRFIGILNDFKSITNKLKQGVGAASDNIVELIENINGNSFFRFIFGKKKSSRKREKKD